MGRVLAYTSPARGHLYPIVPIMAELLARGHHDVSVCALAGELAQLERMGIECSPIDPAVERVEIEDWRERSLRGAGLSVLRTFTERSRGEVPDLARAIERFDPRRSARRRQLLGRRDRGRGLGTSVGRVLALPTAAALT
jgi:UDP:flavonoid glycosyltransferase YjiC (YdhE family)